MDAKDPVLGVGVMNMVEIAQLQVAIIGALYATGDPAIRMNGLYAGAG